MGPGSGPGDEDGSGIPPHRAGPVLTHTGQPVKNSARTGASTSGSTAWV